MSAAPATPPTIRPAVVQGPVVLVILDGFGHRDEPRDNAVAAAKHPNWDRFLHDHPHTLLAASEMRVGLPKGQMGNSEVGHLNMGAGRVVYMDSTRITRDVENGAFFRNDALGKAMDRVRDKGALHLMGLVSDGGVHSYQSHLEALVRMAKQRGLTRVYVHAFLDGRDTPPSSAAGYVQQLADFLKAEGVGRIATVSGRFYAMDRDKRWERTAQAWRALVMGEGKVASDPVQAIRDSYAEGVTDEFMVPVVMLDHGQPVARIERGDSVIFFNFRADRARQLTAAIALEEFASFARPEVPHVYFVQMSVYDEKFPFAVAFPPEPLTNILAKVLADHGVKNFRVAETEKYAHVTYFFNGGEEKPFAGEERLLIPSTKDVATYDKKPEMSARGITDALVSRIAEGRERVFVCNIANPDMVGHTGVMEATVQAVEVVDECLGRIAEAVLSRKGALLVTADHGNCELMRDPVTGQPHTAHTTFPVPFVLVQEGARGPLRSGGALEDVGPTILGLLGIDKPEEMTGRDLRDGH